ncbi:MAG TPA: hypothetical protein VGS96_08195 [Thermoanaerobaculia bacterium]|jgi:hypothetical protein|nr:hypothetical protein [Thermoanaerobaculia bacterium]
MPNRISAAITLALLVTVRTEAVTLTAQQITPSNDGLNQDLADRMSSTSGGKILFVRTNNDTVYLYDGTTEQSWHPSTGKAVRTSAMMLGPGSSAGTVVGAWRRGDGEAWVSVNGGAPQLVDKNPEHFSIRDGCVFMVLQTGATGNHAFKVNPSDGSFIQLSSVNAPANNGVFRVFASGCNQAVWSWLNGGSPTDLYYWNGTTAILIASDINELNASFAGGKLVYPKKVSGIEQVFLIDTNVSLSPVQLSAETDATKILARPQTDGRHVAWYRYNNGGAEIVLNGGIVFPIGPLAKIDNEWPYQLDRGQLLWTNAASGSPRTFFYDDGTQTFTRRPPRFRIAT